MVAAARALADPAERAERLRAALDLWRGDALDDTVSAWCARAWWATSTSCGWW